MVPTKCEILDVIFENMWLINTQHQFDNVSLQMLEWWVSWVYLVNLMLHLYLQVVPLSFLWKLVICLKHLQGIRSLCVPFVNQVSSTCAITSGNISFVPWAIHQRRSYWKNQYIFSNYIYILHSWLSTRLVTHFHAAFKFCGHSGWPECTISITVPAKAATTWQTHWQPSYIPPGEIGKENVPLLVYCGSKRAGAQAGPFCSSKKAQMTIPTALAVLSAWLLTLHTYTSYICTGFHAAAVCFAL